MPTHMYILITNMYMPKNGALIFLIVCLLVSELNVGNHIDKVVRVIEQPKAQDRVIYCFQLASLLCHSRLAWKAFLPGRRN